MNKGLFSKLAASNIKKNSRTYIPYIISCIFTIAMFYIVNSLSYNEGLKNTIGGGFLQQMLGFGTYIIALFSLIFLFYTNSFLVKQRKKEFGLYNILGMEKKHLGIVIALETMYTAVICLIMGLGLGFLLDKLMYLLIAKVLGGEIMLGFYISSKSVMQTVILFGVIFILTLLNSVRLIRTANPIELLNGGKKGEKEPKTKWVTAILGIICLAAGYTISIKIKDPLNAILFFFVAVILVIIGTYLIFTAGSIALLKILRKNKGFYYKTKHFTSISSMIYRMKQNAVGLANICILSTMVLVILSTTVSLIVGVNDIINTRYPYDMAVECNYENNDKNIQTVSDIKQEIIDENISVSDTAEYTYLSFSTVYNEDKCQYFTQANVDYSDSNVSVLIVVTLDDYNTVSGMNETLESNQVLLSGLKQTYEYPSITIGDKKFSVKGTADDFKINGFYSAVVYDTKFIVVNDMNTLYDLYHSQKEAYGDNASKIKYYYGFNSDSDTDTLLAFNDKIYNEYINDNDIKIECKENKLSDAMGLYSSIFFLGVFLGALFIMATILIIYFKQISEGYDDKERFEIMQKVGMSHSEVKSSIHSQILTVFFLPLIVAAVHIAFAFPIITKLLICFMLYNTNLYVICTVVCFLGFAVLYGIIYALTSKTYYRIVSR